MKTFRTIALLALISTLPGCKKPDDVLPKSASPAMTSSYSAPSGSTEPSVKVPVNPSCNKILVDASHDGGVWWFPQGPPNFNANDPHQGQPFVQMLRGLGYTVDELPRGQTITDEILNGYKIIFRTAGFFQYSADELSAYQNALNRGITLLLVTDHKKYEPSDGLAEMLGVEFKGLVGGTISRFSGNSIVKNVTAIDYMVGSVLTNCELNKNIEPVGWLSDNDHVDYNFNGVVDAGEPGGMPVLGILHHEQSRIFMSGDLNFIEVMPQPFTANLVKWISECDGVH
jgi:hypothetical protein